ncbi:cation:proton antiporter [Aspergillus thermomutatus]|uniref:Cation/H+ exchanger transmembrane domain-containing protein n=1 Tax=Aspergillus thermomutatus TaxID=41047 RepID=A0A397GML0_ASPTH|nr:uncharacterized protein CDV56_107168 [Aspergillus thermomutatus]RHZ52282.1 hypothetical protein CDV56_107168 [Aspergillus thermomutatus]
MAASRDALAYHEPGIQTILIQSSFLLALNWVNTLLDKLIYCGLIGQLLIGMAWGVPGANWLELDVQKTIQQLGYLGLLLLVYEGGLSTSFSQLKSNFVLSSVVAITGASVPMALSFVLMRLVSATPLQAFAAGASLCSTSIGTTFTILSTTGLAKTRLGVVLGSAAMMDDVAGLVMVQIISNLGGASQQSSFDPVVVIRPILVAFGFALGLLLICRFVVAVVVRTLQTHEIRSPAWMRSLNGAFVGHMLYLIGLVTGAQYAGTSGLFAAYLAGASISWLDEMLATNEKQPKTEIPANDQREHRPESIEMQTRLTRDASNTQRSHREAESTETPAPTERTMHFERPTGELTFETFCKEPLKRILSPLFFASIGFSIPITKIFEAKVIWRGVVYTLLMAFGKLVTGFWLIRLTVPRSHPLTKAKQVLLGVATVSAVKSCKTRSQPDSDSSRASPQGQAQSDGPRREESQPTPGLNSRKEDAQLPAAAAGTDSTQEGTCPVVRISGPQLPPKPRSLYPASILGLAMVARGEIGYLIASLAETDRIFSPHSSPSPVTSSQEVASEIYLVVIWAITLCTFIGPLCVGPLVKRVKTLQRLRTRSGGEDPLGTWGVS